MPRRALPCLLLAACLAAPRLARAAPLDLEALLAAPLSPGRVLLLNPHAGDRRVDAPLRAALRHDAPAVRAAAARVIGVSGLRHLLPFVAEALAAEADGWAAVEQGRALALIGDAGAQQTAAQAAVRLDACCGGAARALADAVLDRAAVTAPGELTTLAQALPADRFGGSWGRALALAVRTAPDRAEPLAAAAVDMGEGVWTAYLAASRQARASVPAATLVAALARTGPVATATIWHVGALAGDDELDAEMTRALMAAITATPAGDSPERYLAALLARRAGQRDDERRWGAAAAAWTTGEAVRLAEVVRLARYATPAERQAIGKALGRTEWSAPPQRTKRPDEDRGGPLVRTPTPFPPGLITDLLAVTGCRPSPRSAWLAEAAYRPDLRPQRVSLLGTVALPEPKPEPGIAPECAQAANALLAASLAPRDAAYPTTAPHLVMVPLLPEVLACADAATLPPPPLDGAAVLAGRLTPPAVTKEVTPFYPDAARRAGFEGQVTLTAEVGLDGCVQGAAVTRSVHPQLDLSALAALTQWRFAPPMAGGAPAPVQITVVLSFSLR